MDHQNSTDTEVTLIKSLINSPVNLIIFSLDRNYCYTAYTRFHSETMKKIWNVDIRVGFCILDVMTDPAEREKAKNNYDRALRGEYFFMNEEYGEGALYRACYDDHYSPVKDPDGTVTGLSVFVIEVTRLNAEQEKEKIQKLLEDSQRIGKIGGWEYDIDNDVLTWTREMYTIHELDPCIQPQVDERFNFYTPESVPEVDRVVQEAIRTGGSYELDSEIITAKGNRRFVKAMGQADLENRRIFGFFQDITERKQAQDELRIRNDQLRELNATKDKFFSIIAHDLINPFNVILGLSTTIHDEGRDMDLESILKYCDSIHSSTLNTYRLLENLLEWARMQQGAIPFEPRAVLVRDIIDVEIDNLAQTARQKNIILLGESQDELVIHADEKMLTSVVRNLISNAIKFTPKHGKIIVNAIKNGSCVDITVLDTGIGMSQLTIEKLFKMETSFSTRGTGNEKGSGLGLLLCKEFVEKHGGTISVESEDGKGSRFKVSIPIE